MTKLIHHVQNDVSCSMDPPHLSHYRDIPEEVDKAYQLLETGAQMVHSTATKYTLMGKINKNNHQQHQDDQLKLRIDLLRGCQ